MQLQVIDASPNGPKLNKIKALVIQYDWTSIRRSFDCRSTAIRLVLRRIAVKRRKIEATRSRIQRVRDLSMFISMFIVVYQISHPNPRLLQATRASLTSNSSSHTVPQLSPWFTSRRPSRHGREPLHPTSRMLPSPVVMNRRTRTQ